MALNLEVVLEMGDRGFQSLSSALTNFTASSMYLDPSDYDGATYYFEIVGRNSHATLPYTVDLYEGANLMASIIMAANTPTGSDTLRQRSTSFVPSSGNHVYTLRTPQTGANSDVSVDSCRIVVVQVAATKTRLQFPLAHTASTGTAQGTPTFHTQFNSTTYGQNLPYKCALVKLEASLLLTIAAGSPWSWETIGSSTGAATNIGLFDATANAQITGIENSHTTQSIQTQDFAHALLTDGNDLEVRVKSSAGSVSASAHAARLYVRLTSLASAAVYRRVGPAATGPVTSAPHTSRQRIDTSVYGSPVVYFEGTGFESVSGTVVMDLGESTSDDSSNAASAVASSTLTFDGATKIRQRTGALSITSDNRFVTKYTRSSGTLNQAMPVVIIVTTPPAPTGRSQTFSF